MVRKPLTSTAQVVTTSHPQQRLIMPATPLPIQPNFTNLPPGTVFAPAPGGGNVGYAVVPAQYVTQVSGVLSNMLGQWCMRCTITVSKRSLVLCCFSVSIVTVAFFAPPLVPAITICDPGK